MPCNVCNEQLAQYHVTTDLEQRILSPNWFSHRKGNCLGNWNTAQLEACCNKPLIQRVRQLLHDVRLQHTLSISWINANIGASTPDSLGNATADRLAARECSGSSGVLTSLIFAVRHPGRSSSQFAPLDPLRRPKRRRRVPTFRDPRRSLYTATLSAAHRLVLLYKLG